jgi:hypothetical protein
LKSTRGAPTSVDDCTPWKRVFGRELRSKSDAMAQKSAKKKPRKADQESVLGSLPSTRPARMGRARRGSENGGGTATATAAKPKPRAATKPKPRAAKKAPPRATESSRPTATPPASAGRRAMPPRGLEIVTTGAQAAGEIARIGLTVGGQVLKRAARRLPRR